MGYKDFGFNVLTDGKIEFQLMYDTGILPEKFPAKRPKVTREQKAAMKTAAMGGKGTEAAPTAIVATQPDAAAAKPVAPAMVETAATALVVDAAAKQVTAKQPAPTTKPTAAKDTAKDTKPTDQTTKLTKPPATKATGK